MLFDVFLVDGDVERWVDISFVIVVDMIMFIIICIYYCCLVKFGYIDGFLSGRMLFF